MLVIFAGARFGFGGIGGKGFMALEALVPPPGIGMRRAMRITRARPLKGKDDLLFG